MFLLETSLESHLHRFNYKIYLKNAENKRDLISQSRLIIL